MTRKDYVAIAAAMARVIPLDNDRGSYRVWEATVCSLADYLATTNPRFDRERFLKACGV